MTTIVRVVNKSVPVMPVMAGRICSTGNPSTRLRTIEHMQPVRFLEYIKSRTILEVKVHVNGQEHKIGILSVPIPYSNEAHYMVIQTSLPLSPSPRKFPSKVGEVFETLAMEIAEYVKKQTGKEPIIAFNDGSLCSGNTELIKIPGGQGFRLAAHIMYLYQMKHIIILAFLTFLPRRLFYLIILKTYGYHKP